MSRIVKLPKPRRKASSEVPIRPYGEVAIYFHWVSAALISASWLTSEMVSLMPRALRSDIWSMHVLFGLVLAVVIAGRIFWRWRRAPARPREQRWLDALGSFGHFALYALIVVTIALGLTDALLRGCDMLGLWALPNLHGNSGLVRRTTHWHDLAANGLIALALLHAAAALFHHFILQDGLLRRMTPAPWVQERARRADGSHSAGVDRY